MRKTTIKVCFCFLDRAVWFINSSSLLPYWFFNSKVKNEDDTTNDDEHFILERRTSNDNFIFKQTIVCSCMDCFRFQVSISSDENFSCLSNVDCRFVKKDLNDKLIYNWQRLNVLRGKKIETVCSGCVIFIIKRSDPSDVIVVN